MNNYIDVVKSVLLFKGINNIKEVFCHLEYRIVKLNPEMSIFNVGDYIKEIGIVLSGNLKIVKNDINGNEFILASLAKKDIFGESFAISENISSVTVTATSNAEIILIKYSDIIKDVSILKNLLFMLSKKNISLNQKIDLLSIKNLRERIYTYLKEESIKNKSLDFYIDFSRNELSEYLCADRSALSRCLSNLRKQGKIKYKKNHFIIIA